MKVEKLTEDKIYRDTDELKALGLDELESVAGGWADEDLSDEDRRHWEQLKEMWRKALSDYDDNKISSEEYKAVTKLLLYYGKALDKKYG